MSSLFADFFDRVVSFCTDQSNVTPQQLSLGTNKRSVHYWNPETKEVVEVEKVRPDNRHKLLNVASVIQYAKALEPYVTHTNIWVGPKAVTIECQENDPQDVITMPLELTPLFALLERLKIKPSVPQSEAIRLLRQQFAAVDVNKKALTMVAERVATCEQLNAELSTGAVSVYEGEYFVS